MREGITGLRADVLCRKGICMVFQLTCTNSPFIPLMSRRTGRDMGV